MAERTLPPSRVTTGTTTVDFGGLSPLDAYGKLIDRPLSYLESTIASSVSTATASIPTQYVQATLIAGMSGNMSASAGHYKTWATGQSVGKISSLAAWVHLDSLFTAYTGGLDVSGVITPLNIGIRCEAGVITLTTSMVVFGMHAQYLAGAATVAPTYLMFARLNCSTALTSLFYTENSQSAGMVVANTHTTEVAQIPLIWIHGAGPTLDQALFVKLYRD